MTFVNKNKILGILITKQSKKDILEKIKKYFINPNGFLHIVSLNLENIIMAQEDKNFKKVIEAAQIKIIDGIGVVIAGRILKIELERIAGVDLMLELIKIASQERLRLLLIGGKPNLANSLANCYQNQSPQAYFKGIYGIKDIKNPQKKEEQEIFSIVADFKPHIVLVAFGSPDQELWLYRHRDQFKNCLCMGVGGAFDYLSGSIIRAPGFLRKIGLEWLFRLLKQPWRWRRQLRLIKFLWLVVKQKLGIIE